MNAMKLDELSQDQSGTITHIDLGPSYQEQLHALGVCVGAQVERTSSLSKSQVLISISTAQPVALSITLARHISINPEQK